MSYYHEPPEELGEQARNITRALNSLKEEVEAVDWYNQRAVTTNDTHLRNIVEHNRDEEIEHACMTLEWLRQNVPAWDEHLRTYLFTDRDVTEVEEEEEGGEDASEKSGSSDLGIGKLS